MKFSRRDVLKLGAGSVVVAATGTAKTGRLGLLASSASSTPAPRATSASAPPGPYRTEPGLRPPPINVLTPAHDTAPGWIILSPSAYENYQGGLLIADNHGEPIWFQPKPHGPANPASTIGVTGASTTNFAVQTYNGERALTWWEGDIILPGYGAGKYYIADSSYNVVKVIEGGKGQQADLHDLYLTNRNTALFPTYDKKAANLSSLGGPAKGAILDSLFQEVDLKTGAVVFQWRASDFVALSESYVPAPTKAGLLYDFFHINSVSLAPDGNYIVSGRHTWCVYKVNRTDGSIMWRLNGKKSNFTMGPGAHFAWQHHVRALTNTELTIFDDGAGPAKTEKDSRGLKVNLDMAKKTAELQQAFVSKPDTLAGSQGSVEELPDGHVFVGWGASPYFSEYTADGSVLFEASLVPGAHSYRAFREMWNAKPPSEPRVVAERQGSTVTVYASWNGATAIADWQVLVGPKSDALAPLQNFSRSGFETVMRVTTDEPYVAVRALDVKGGVLGKSASVSV